MYKLIMSAFLLSVTPVWAAEQWPEGYVPPAGYDESLHPEDLREIKPTVIKPTGNANGTCADINLIVKNDGWYTAVDYLTHSTHNPMIDPNKWAQIIVRYCKDHPEQVSLLAVMEAAAVAGPSEAAKAPE
jgi:hypothetical protein